MTGIDVTVVVCAHTQRRLPETVACVAALGRQVPAPTAIVVVVDHAPTLAALLAERLPATVEVVANDGRRGLSDARNRGLRAARTPLVAFVDDDAEVRPGWLAALVAPFADATVVVTGGRAEPRWPATAPAWFPAELRWVVGCSYAGMVDDGDVRNVIGCTMAVRAAAVAAAGPFDTGIGRLGSRPLGCEETELCIRLRRVLPGSRVVAVPGAVVDHHVSADRVRPRYLLSRGWCEGLSKARVAQLASAGTALSAERTYATRTLPRAVGRALRDTLLGAVGGRGAAAARAALLVGTLGATVAGYVAGQTVHRRSLAAGLTGAGPDPAARPSTEPAHDTPVLSTGGGGR